MHEGRTRSLLPFAVYAVGLAITAWYVFGTIYLTMPDAVREFELFKMMRMDNYWSVYHYVHSGAHQYILQVSCLFTTYIPAKISLLFTISPELFYKTYITLLLPFLPVIVYTLAWRFVTTAYAFIAALFIISWMSFIDGASTARTGIALIFFALFLLLYFWRGNKYVKYTGMAVSLVCIPFAHYSVAILSTGIIGALAFISLIYSRTKWVNKKILFISAAIMVVVTISWCAKIWDFALPIVDPTLGNPNVNIWVPDTPSQAAIGINNPDSSHSMIYTYALMVIAWLTIMITAFGLLKALRDKAYLPEIRALGFILFGLSVAFFLLPPISRIYGVERVYLQALIILGIFFVYGIEQIARKIHLSGYILGFPLVLLYGSMMKIYELIHSIMEHH